MLRCNFRQHLWKFSACQFLIEPRFVTNELDGRKLRSEYSFLIFAQLKKAASVCDDFEAPHFLVIIYAKTRELGALNRKRYT
jgi:hypothetical protein